MKPGDILEGRFELEERIGAGGMGEVFRGRDLTTGDAVAIKVMLGAETSQSARFAREARVLSKLSSPGIVRYVTHGTGPTGEPFLVMEWLSGEDLSQRLRRGHLSVGETVKLGIQVAEALSLAHARDVVHRDLKPSNLFLVEGDIGHVKVLDFGIAWQRDLTRMTRTGGMVGTPGYMAPEQARGEVEIDARADVFSLGCVLYECLTGRPAFSANHAIAILAKLLFDDPPRLREIVRGVPEGLDALVAQMLAKEPGARPRDGAAVATALVALGTAPTVLMEPASGVPSQLAAALTDSERRIVSVVVIGRAPGPATAVAPTLGRTELHASMNGLRRAVEEHGGVLEPLADGSAVVTIMGATGVATDQATQAARCALALRVAWRDRPMALATGRVQVTGKLPVGDAIDRAARLLASLGAEGHALPLLIVDDVTAGLLDARFEVVEGPAGLELRAEHPLAEGTRTLLGKATACVGREWELGTLEGFFHECAEESVARVVLVTAPAGMGKSRLAYELVRRLRSRGEAMATWIGRIDSLRAGSAFGLLGHALRSALGVRDGDPLEARRQTIEVRVSQQVALPDRRRVAEFLGEIVSTPFPDEGSAPLRAARQNAELMGDQMQRAWVDFLRAESKARPVLVVLEDLHWGDLPTVRFIDAALRELRGAPWMVVALARPEVHERFPRLWAERNLQEIRLKELSRKASERLVRQVLGAGLGAETVERIVMQAEGHAFYLEELIRAVAEKNGAALPETVLAMVEARLQRLPPEARRVLRAASVFGEVCWQGGVMELLGEAMRTTEVRGTIDGLVEREVLSRRVESRFPGEPELAFRHALLREGAYAMLTDEDRALGHRLAGAWLERAGEQDPMVLAEHFERGEEPRRAVACYLHAARQALRGQDTVASIARAERGIHCGAEGEAYLDLVLMLAESLVYNCDNARALGRADEVLRLAQPGSRVWLMGLALTGGPALGLGASDTLAEVGRTLVSIEPEAASSLVAALSAISRPLLWRNLFELAEHHALRAEQIRRSLVRQEPWLTARIEWMCAGVAEYQGNAWSALNHHKRAEAGYAESGDPRHMALMRVAQGQDLGLLGAYAEGQNLLEELLGSGDATPLVVLAARHCLVQIKVERGAPDEALVDAMAMADAAPAHQDPWMLGVLRALFARIQLRRRDMESAEREALLAVELLVQTPRDRALALATLADIRLAQRRPAEALAAVQQALSALTAIPPAYRAGAYVPLMHAEALHAMGDHEAARATIAAARAALLARAEQIGDPDYRRSFLENVSENARTLARAREWLGE